MSKIIATGARPPRHVLGLRPAWSHIGRLAPGLFLTSIIAALAFGLRILPGVAVFSPLILSILIGMVFHNTLGTPARAKPGVTFSLRRILRGAIILLGLQLTVTQVIELGGLGLLIIVITLLATFFFTLWLGHRLHIDHALTTLIAAGTSICGASAVIATNTVAGGSDEDVAYAVAAVTVFGSLSMFLYPTFPALLHLAPHTYGLWAGASIHEIAQVVAAAFQNGRDAGNFGTIAKLSRVILLAPMVLVLGYVAARRASRAAPHALTTVRQRVPMPWFVVGFIGMILFNSFDLIPQEPKGGLVQATTFFLSMALAAMGLETDFRKLRARGWKPLILGAASWFFIAGFSLLLIEITHA